MSLHDFSSRRCRLTDWPGVFELLQRNFEQLSRDELRYYLRHHHHNFHLLLKNAELIGMICCFSKGEHYWLELIAIKAEHRGTGVSAKLLEHFEELAETQGHRRLDLAVRRDNHLALSLYGKHGFSKQGSQGEDLYFKKELEATSGNPIRGRKKPGWMRFKLASLYLHVLGL